MSNYEWLEEAQMHYAKSSNTTGFGYDAIEDTKRRRSPRRTVSAEDRHLRQSDRKTLIATSRDVRRNFAVARFIIQKHIDFVVEHNFLPRTGDDATNRALKDFFKRVSRKDKFDVSGRFSLRRYLRMMESARIVDGDILSVKTRSGRVQPIEADRIRDPQHEALGSQDLDDWVNGVKIGESGRHQYYSIHRRKQAGFEFERVISANRALIHGFYDRFDQTRGNSPLAPVINSLKDLYESFDYALARSKVEQLFALAITKSDDWGVGAGDEEDADDHPRELDFTKGPQILDLDSGEAAEFLMAKSPAASSQEFWKSMIMMTLKCLNIPYFFYDEKNTNFFGAKSGLTLYLRSVRGWREDVVDWLNEWFCWRLKVGVDAGEISLPDGFDCDDYSMWDFQPLGIEYWDPLKEINADAKSIEVGLRTREQVRLERYGDSWEMDVYPELLKEAEMMEAIRPPEETSTPEETQNDDDD